LKLTFVECCNHSFERETFKTDLHVPCSYTGHKCLYHCAQPLRSRSLKSPGGMEAFRVVLLFKLATWTKSVAAEIHKSCKVPKSSYCIGTHLQFFYKLSEGLGRRRNELQPKTFYLSYCWYCFSQMPSTQRIHMRVHNRQHWKFLIIH